MLCFFDTTLQKESSAGSKFSLNLTIVVWSTAARKELAKLQLAQNRAVHFALHCNQRADINTIHASLSWLRV